MNTYEMMFLFDPTAGANWAEAEAEINRLMQRAGAEVLVLKKLEERRLAYEIRGRKRGLYVLCYFKASGNKMSALERDTHLSETILRFLILRADDLSLEKMQNATLVNVAQDFRPGRSDYGYDDRGGRRDNDMGPSGDLESGIPELVGSVLDDADSRDA